MQTINFTDHTLYMNAAHIIIKDAKTGQVLYERDNASDEKWYDESHAKIVKAAQAFEDACLEAIQSERQS